MDALGGTAGEEQAAVRSPRLCPRLFCLGDAVHVLPVQVAGGGQLGEVQTGVFCWQAGDGLAFVARHGHPQGILGGKLGQGVVEGGGHRGFPPNGVVDWKKDPHSRSRWRVFWIPLRDYAFLSNTTTIRRLGSVPVE